MSFGDRRDRRWAHTPSPGTRGWTRPSTAGKTAARIPAGTIGNGLPLWTKAALSFARRSSTISTRSRSSNAILSRRSGLPPFASLFPARAPSAGDRRDHRGRDRGLCARCAAQRRRARRASTRLRSTRALPGAASVPPCSRHARNMRGCMGAPRLRSRCATTMRPPSPFMKNAAFDLFGEHSDYYADGATALRYRKSPVPVLTLNDRGPRTAAARRTSAEGRDEGSSCCVAGASRIQARSFRNSPCKLVASPPQDGWKRSRSTSCGKLSRKCAIRSCCIRSARIRASCCMWR